MSEFLKSPYNSLSKVYRFILKLPLCLFSTELDTYLQNGVCRVQSNAKIVKAGFHSFRSILDQNALLKASQTSRKCAQEFSSGKEWVLRCLDTFGGRSATAKLQELHCSVLYESFMVWG